MAFAEQVKNGLPNLDFPQRQEMRRLLVEKVTCYYGRAVVFTIIPPPADEKVHLYATPRKGMARGERIL